MVWFRIEWIYILGVILIAGCTTTEKIVDGRSAYDRKRYAQAIQYFLPEYERARFKEVKGELAYLLGDSYDHIGYYADAQKWFYEAYDMEFGLQALLKYADMSQKLGEYSEAVAAYKLLARETNDLDRFQKQINAATLAQDWKTQSDQESYLKVTNQETINSPKSDVINQVFGPDYFLFSSDRDDSEGRNYYAWTGHKFYDIYQSMNQVINPFDDLYVNTGLHESDGSYDAKKQLFVFTRCEALDEEYDVYCKIMFSRKDEEGVWSDPVELPFTVSNVNFMHPFVTPDGNRIYFASDIDKNAKGYDLFYTDWQDEAWNEPEILNVSEINTEYNELYPSFYNDTLYFSSDRPGMGGLDIYKTYVVNGRYVYPQNLLPPINSSFDDFKYLPFEPNRNDILRAAYFSSNRNGGTGSDDIYLFYHELSEPLLVTNDRENEKYTYRLKIRTVTRKENPETGEVLRFPLENSQVRVQGAVDTTMTSDLNGEMIIPHYKLTPLSVAFSKPAYFTYKENVSLNKLGKPDTTGQVITYNFTKLMDPIVKNKEIVLENIYYDYDRWNIRPDARPILDSLANLLQDNPEIIKIELTSHTDCRGSEEYNEDLSQKRAESAVEYLVRAGVSPDRMVARGYGESQPVVDCVCESCTEEEHQANRRTAFKILE